MFITRLFTLYPEMFPGPLSEGLFGKAMENKLWKLENIDIRKYSSDKNLKVDDTPYGGGIRYVNKTRCYRKCFR